MTSSNSIQEFEVELVEKEILTADMIAKEVLTVDLNSIDVIEYMQKEVISNVKHEVATKITNTQFETSTEYIENTLKVFLNGLKVAIADITYDTATKFSIVDITKIGDIIEVEYIEKTS